MLLARLLRRPDRDAVARRTAQLDPERDHLEIYRLLALHEFPWDHTRALETALYRTYAVPSIGGLLAATGEFTQRVQKRYDDTSLLLAEVLEDGYDGPRGAAALARINELHARYPIAMDDYRYVLSTFVVVPVRWLDRYGWRPLSDGERHAVHAYYREVGTRMGIHDIPSTYEELAAFSDAYEAAHFAFTARTREVGLATRELFVQWLRPVPAPLVRLGVHAVLDAPVRDAFAMPHPPAVVEAAVDAGLRLRAHVLRHLPGRRRPASVRESWFVRSYPDGYRIGELGPAPASPGAHEGPSSPRTGRRTLLSRPREASHA